MIKISKRLTMAASLINDGNVLADVGTDHGYVPIYLVEQGKIQRAVAMDINKGPLERAKAHIAQYGMEQYIETRLSDGVEALAVGEADTLLIAGMGGGLVIHILTAGREVCQGAKALVLQPQSELERVRYFLTEEGYVTDAEEMTEEDGKYYPMMRVHYEPQRKNIKGKKQVFFIYGQMLLENRHPVLHQFLEKEQKVYQGILENLKKQPQTAQIVLRTGEIEAALEWNKEALNYYYR